MQSPCSVSQASSRSFSRVVNLFYSVSQIALSFLISATSRLRSRNSAMHSSCSVTNSLYLASQASARGLIMPIWVFNSIVISLHWSRSIFNSFCSTIQLFRYSSKMKICFLKSFDAESHFFCNSDMPALASSHLKSLAFIHSFKPLFESSHFRYSA